MAYKHIKVPAGGDKIKVNKDFSLSVPDNPIIPYIEGDATGVDITPVMLKVVDAAVKKAYGGKKKIVWMEMFAGGKATRGYGGNVWQTYRSSSWRNATLMERMPPPTGVVSGPLIETTNSFEASRVSSGSQTR